MTGKRAYVKAWKRMRTQHPPRGRQTQTELENSYGGHSSRCRMSPTGLAVLSSEALGASKMSGVGHLLRFGVERGKNHSRWNIQEAGAFTHSGDNKGLSASGHWG